MIEAPRHSLASGLLAVKQRTVTIGDRHSLPRNFHWCLPIGVLCHFGLPRWRDSAQQKPLNSSTASRNESYFAARVYLHATETPARPSGLPLLEALRRHSESRHDSGAGGTEGLLKIPNLVQPHQANACQACTCTPQHSAVEYKRPRGQTSGLRGHLTTGRRSAW